MVAAKSAVMAPTSATIFCASGTDEYNGAERVMRYTPAVTIVAAWIKAETGVGPSIASGNQTYNGNWADLPTAPQKIRRAAMVVYPALKPRVVHFEDSSSNITVPEADQTIKIPSMNPKSPIRLTINALLAASAADARSNQRPIRM